MRKSIEILLIDDSPSDVGLTAEALLEGRMSNNLRVASNGPEALAFLRRQGKFAGAQRPDLILLDLNMPKMSGREVLSEIKNDPALKRIPVVILTTSKAESDIIACYDLHANCCITKPVDFEQFVRVVETIENFWLTVVALPCE